MWYYDKIILLVFLLLLCTQVNSFPFGRRKQREKAERMPHSLVHGVNVSDFSGYGLIKVLENNQNRKSGAHHNSAYATFVPSMDSIAPLEVFLFSLEEVATQHSVLILITDEILGRIETLDTLLSRYDDTIGISVYSVKSPMKDLWKPFLWALPGFKEVFYLQCGSVFMKNADSVFRLGRWYEELLGMEELGRSNSNDLSLTDSAFLLKPSLTVFHRMLSAALMSPSKLPSLKELAPSANVGLPIYFNMPKTVQKTKPMLWHDKVVFILRFDGEQPWRYWSTRFYRRTFVDPAIQQRLLASGEWDPDEYEPINSWWREKYLMARQKELSQSLTIYQAYHAPKCWGPLNQHYYFRYVRLNGPMRDKSDIDAQALHAPLNDSSLQLALGEFGAMLAVAEMPMEQLSPFVGFTSWKEHIKADWKEGASIDWTKVRLKPRHIYFWYSLYHQPEKNLYEMIDAHHPGMRAILQSVIPFPLPDLPPQSKTHRYIYGNYFILSKELFKEFVASASAVMKAFLQKYPLGSTCPYSVPTDTELPMHRCVGYLLERYVNIWAEHENLTFVYAVDEPVWRNS